MASVSQSPQDIKRHMAFAFEQDVSDHNTTPHRSADTTGPTDKKLDHALAVLQSPSLQLQAQPVVNSPAVLQSSSLHPQDQSVVKSGHAPAVLQSLPLQLQAQSVVYTPSGIKSQSYTEAAQQYNKRSAVIHRAPIYPNYPIALRSIAAPASDTPDPAPTPVSFSTKCLSLIGTVLSHVMGQAQGLVTPGEKKQQGLVTPGEKKQQSLVTLDEKKQQGLGIPGEKKQPIQRVQKPIPLHAKLKPMDGKYAVLLFGKTGSGKSTLVNMLFNYFRGGTLDKPVLGIPTAHIGANVITAKSTERRSENQSESQTADCTKYYFCHPLNKNAHFEFIDSPGMCDTRGIEMDETNLGRIFAAAMSAHRINALVLVQSGREPRLTVEMKTVMARLRANMPDVLLDNLFVCFTNCDADTCNLSISTVKEILGRYRSLDVIAFHMDNSMFSRPQKEWENKERMFERFNCSMKTIDEMLLSVTRKAGAAAQVFSDMSVRRNTIRSTIAGLTAEMDKMDKVKELLEMMQNAKKMAAGDMEKYKNYMQDKEVEYYELETTAYHNTVCTKCPERAPCHEKCGLEFNGTPNNAHFFSRCACMQGGVNCHLCNCHADSHFHDNKKYVKRLKMVQEILKDVKASYDTASSQVAAAQTEEQAAVANMVSLERAIKENEQRVETECKTLKSICRGFNFAQELASVLETLQMHQKNLTTFTAKDRMDKQIKSLKLLVDTMNRT